MRRVIITILLGLFVAGGLTAHPAEAQATESRYLSGTDKDHTVPWEFMVSDGRRKGEWTTIPVPSNWELHGFGTYTYGQEKNKAVEEGLYINGRRVLLKGVNRHSFWPESGRTTSRDISVGDVGLMKDMNMNAVRMSHYPPDRHFLEACDELGLYVIDELTGWQAAYDTVTGESWVYPEFRGFFGDLYWAVIGTRTQPITVVAETPGLYLRMLTPRAPKDPRFTAVAFPEGGISFMHAIPPIGTEFHAASAYGPEGQLNLVNGRTGTYTGTLHFAFGPADLQ